MHRAASERKVVNPYALSNMFITVIFAKSLVPMSGC